jgi:hypothetical protein
MRFTAPPKELHERAAPRCATRTCIWHSSKNSSASSTSDDANVSSTPLSRALALAARVALSESMRASNRVKIRSQSVFNAACPMVASRSVLCQPLSPVCDARGGRPHEHESARGVGSLHV